MRAILLAHGAGRRRPYRRRRRLLRSGTWTLTLDGQTKAYGMTWMASWADVAVYAHEEGHSLGLPHSSGPSSNVYDSCWDVMSDLYTNFDVTQGSYIGQHTNVAEAGGGRSTETLLRCYTQADEATMLAVVSETRKVRAAGAQP